jgi:hypothetical protein
MIDKEHCSFHATLAMDKLVAALHEFKAFVVDYAVDACVYQLPVSEKDSDLNVPYLPSLDVIEFERFLGADGISMAASSICNLQRYPSDPALNIRRWPGFVRFDASVRDVMVDKISFINQLKDDLAGAMECFPLGASRTNAAKRLFPAIHLLAAYRHIHCASVDVTHLGFTWLGKSPKNVSIDKVNLMTRLLNMQSVAGLHGDDAMVGFIEQELALLADYPEHLLVQRKVHAPSPRLAVFFDQRISSPEMLIQAPLPFFIAQNDPPSIHHLPFFYADQVHKGNSDDKYLPLVPRLGVFAKIA